MNLADLVTGYKCYLEKKLLHLAELDQLTDNIFDELEAEQEEQLAGIFVSVEKLIRQIDELDRQYIEVRESIKKAASPSESFFEASGLKKLEQNMLYRLQEIQEKDQRIIKLMGLRRIELMRNLKQINEGKKMRNAYDGGYSQGEGIFIDRLK